MFYRLPPAGNRIECSESIEGNHRLPDFLSSKSYFFDSGAASLAAALVAVVQHSKISHPEVLIPAYVCPEVVSAVLYAGATPVLVDFEVDRPWMDLDALARAVTPQCCAVVAVDLFGIPERLAAIRQVLAERPVCLIEDSAQAFPEKDEGERDHGDLVIYSFGRGKPVSVLGGGAVVVRDASLEAEVAAVYRDAEKVASRRWLSWLKIAVYNCLISPRGYWLPEMLPFLKLGETNFHLMNQISRMDGFGLKILAENINHYWSRECKTQNAIAAGLIEYGDDEVIDLFAVAGRGEERLIRYPLLAKTPQIRDKLYQALQQKKGGASKMYPTTLHGIAGLEGYFPDIEATPNAVSFAQRLLTLPLHQGVTQCDLDEMLGVICRQEHR